MNITEAEAKQLEEDMKIKQRKDSSILWKWFYAVDDLIGAFANKTVKGKEKKYAFVGMGFTIMDTITTRSFLFFNLGYEANYVPARFYSAGLMNEFELLKWLFVAFVIAFNYVCATRGWTKQERAGGRIGLFVTFALFSFVTFWNIGMALTHLFFKV